MKRLRFSILILVVSLVISAAVFTPVQADGGTKMFLPMVMGSSITTSSEPAKPAQPSFPSLDDFTATVINGQSGLITGVYVENVLALNVVQQPTNNPSFVSTDENAATQFSMAARQGVTGLLAHNVFAGAKFYNLVAGQKVVVIFGDGTTQRYTVTGSHRYQALDPYSATSNFKDLETNEILTSGQVFSLYYTGAHHVTFQTCIEQNGNASWGRIFITAEPEA